MEGAGGGIGIGGYYRGLVGWRWPNIAVEKAGGFRYHWICIRAYMFPAGIRSLKTDTVAGSLRETWLHLTGADPAVVFSDNRPNDPRKDPDACS